MAMPADSHKVAGRTEQPTGDLALLLEAEARFAARLAGARRDAERLVAEARAEVEAALEAFNESQARELRELEQRIREELDSRVNRIRQETRQRVEAWLSLDETTLSALAEQVIAPQVVAGLSSSLKPALSNEVSP